MHREAGASGEGHQGIEAELADTAAQQIVQARLRYPETPCSLGLGHSPPGHAFKDLNGHRILAICSRSRDAPKSTSRFAVCRVFFWNA
jgi:hypothetical protein